jgi:dienelactone hydrolase
VHSRTLPWILFAFAFFPGCRRNRVEEGPVSNASDHPPEVVSFPTSDGGTVEADRYGHGEKAVVLAHGARFDKESWANQARVLAKAGFQVLAIDFRGYGRSRGGKPGADPHADLDLDVLAAVRWLRTSGAKSVSVVGGSMGGGAAAQASTEPGEIDRVVLLAPSPIEHPEKMTGRKLFITARDDKNGDGSSRLPSIRDQYERANEPKELIVLESSAHAQFLFDTDQGAKVLDEILRFLSAP